MYKQQKSEFIFSERVQQLSNSTIRIILKVTENPNVISFAGGLPIPSEFPIEVVRIAFDKILSKNGQIALQYGPTEGYNPLRQWIASDLNQSDNINISANQVLIVSGSQQAIDLLSKILIDKGSQVLIENPSYVGALQAFDLYQAKCIPIPIDKNGLIPDAIEPKLAKKARFLYTLPNFQNPTGITLSNSRRRKLLELSVRLNFPIIEDDPYGKLRYTGKSKPSLFAYSNQYGGTVIQLGSFSKILAPGLRLGYVIAPSNVIEKLIQAKQATDLHTSMLTQMAVYEVMKNGFINNHLNSVRNIYHMQSKCMLSAMQNEFPSTVNWTKPDGGMFLWVTLPNHIDSNQLLIEAIEQNVVFVPGESFYPYKDVKNTLRLSFSNVPERKIFQGISILGNILRKYC